MATLAQSITQPSSDRATPISFSRITQRETVGANGDKASDANRLTVPDQDEALAAIVSRPTPARLTTSQTHPATRAEVSGVIGRISPSNVMISILGRADIKEVSLPLSIVPESVRSYGQPVTIRLDKQHGFSTPVVEARKSVSERVPELEVMEGWLNSLDT